MRFVVEQVRRERVQAFMGNVRATRQADKPASSPAANELCEYSLKVLIKATLEPGIWLLAIYESLALHPAEGKSAVNDLLARGLVRVHRFPRKGRGGQPQSLEVLALGIEELARRGITPPLRKIARGGWKHDVYARHLERWAKQQGFACSFERQFGSRFIDFVYEDSQGSLRTIEICLSSSPKWNAEAAIKAAELPGLAGIIVACEERDFLKAIVTEAQQIDSLGLYRGKITGKLLADFVEVSEQE